MISPGGRLAAVAAVLTVAGCAQPAQPANFAGVGQQVNGILRSAYQQTLQARSVTGNMRIAVASGSDVFTSAQGSVSFQFASKLGSARFVIKPAGTLEVIRTSGNIFVRPGNAKSGTTARRWINFKLDSRHAQLPALPEIMTPGADPYQLLVLLRAILCAQCVISEAPAVVAGPSGNHTTYEIILATAKLARHADRADAEWLGQMAAEPGGGKIILAVTIRQGRIFTISGTLPVPDQNSALAAPGPTAVPQTASAIIQFAYGRQPVRISLPDSNQVTKLRSAPS